MDQAEQQLCTQLLITFKHFDDVNKWPRLAHDELLSNDYYEVIEKLTYHLNSIYWYIDSFVY